MVNEWRYAVDKGDYYSDCEPPDVSDYEDYDPRYDDDFVILEGKYCEEEEDF